MLFGGTEESPRWNDEAEILVNKSKKQVITEEYKKQKALAMFAFVVETSEAIIKSFVANPNYPKGGTFHK